MRAIIRTNGRGELSSKFELNFEAADIHVELRPSSVTDRTSITSHHHIGVDGSLCFEFLGFSSFCTLFPLQHQ
jgi:hypothetical protein